MHLKLGKHTLTLDRPRVMGILNVTPDSFSDGGRYFDLSAALAHAGNMAEAGADIIDVGGESTRPGAAEVSVQQELDRVLPVIEHLSKSLDVALSVDTGKPEVMRAAVAAGAGMINDIRALREPGALEAAAGLDAAICLMHMQGTPATMQDEPHYRTLPGDVIGFLAGRIDTAVAAGIGHERIVADPGFGFGKTDAHNLEILAHLDEFEALGVPLLVGLSRKRTLGNVTGRPEGDRLAAGIAAAVIAVAAGADIIRTHDVRETVDALGFARAVRQAGKGR